MGQRFFLLELDLCHFVSRFSIDILLIGINLYINLVLRAHVRAKQDA